MKCYSELHNVAGLGDQASGKHKYGSGNKELNIYLLCERTCIRQECPTKMFTP